MTVSNNIKVPDYFNNIIFENIKALTASVAYFGKYSEKGIIKEINVIDLFNNKSLLDILNDNELKRITKLRLISFGMALRTVFDLCQIDDKKINVNEKDKNTVVINAKTLDNLEALITCEKYNDMELKIGNTTRIYNLVTSYEIKSKQDEYLQKYNAQKYKIRLYLMKTINENKLGSDKSFEFIKEDMSKFKIPTANYNFQKYRGTFKLRQNKYELQTTFDSFSCIDHIGLKKHINNLKLPVNLLSLLQTISEKYLLLSHTDKFNLKIIQNCRDINIDNLQINEGRLDSCSLSTDMNGGKLTIGKQYPEWQYDKKVYNGDGKQICNYSINKKNNESPTMDIHIKSSVGFSDMWPCSKLYRESEDTYYKVINLIPDWLKKKS